jgi:hypothetical protein
MKRIIVWIDSENKESDEVRKWLEKLLRSMELSYTIVETCELREQEHTQ